MKVDLTGSLVYGPRAPRKCVYWLTSRGPWLAGPTYRVGPPKAPEGPQAPAVSSAGARVWPISFSFRVFAIFKGASGGLRRPNLSRHLVILDAGKI